MALLLAVSLGPRVVLAQDVAEHDLTSHHAAISGAWGLVRLPLPPEVLALAAPDLSDVRVVDRFAADVPYVVDREAHLSEEIVADLRSALTPTSASQTHRGRVYTEVYAVGLPATETSDRSTESSLVLETDVASFTASIVVRGVGVNLAATVFRIPAMGVERLEVPLPSTALGSVQITMEGENGFVSPRLFIRRRTVDARPARLERRLEPVGSRMEDTTQVLEFARPAGVLPLTLVVGTSSTTFAAPVTALVRSADEGTRELGRATLYRIPARAAEIPVAESLEITVREWLAGDRIELRIERGDSPPLEEVTVTAVLAEVALVFENRSDGATLHFGGARLRLPVYDLGILAGSLHDPGLPRASLHSIEESPGYIHDQALGFAMRAGAEVDRSRFRRSASVHIPESPEGLTRVNLTPAFLAAASADLSDIRLVSADARQWPYVVAGDVRDESLSAPVTMTDEGRAGWSRYDVALPVGPVTATLLQLDPSERFFSRSAEIWAEVEGARAPQRIETIYLTRDAGRSQSVEFLLSGARVTRLWIAIDDGDEAPLTFGTVTVEVSVQDLLVTAPAGDYQLLAGDELAHAPDYDLARVADSVLHNVSIASAEIGGLEANPAFREPGFVERSGWQSMVLWAVLLLSVVVLLGLTLRLAQGEPEPNAKQPEPKQPEPTKDTEAGSQPDAPEPGASEVVAAESEAGSQGASDDEE